jgi:hypothetical protein
LKAVGNKVKFIAVARILGKTFRHELLS